jgi:hypothetical protein
MTDGQQEDLLTEASLAIRKLQIAYPAAYQEAETALTSILVLKTRLKALSADPCYTSYPIKNDDRHATAKSRAGSRNRPRA